jgi:hypothetical protein
VVWIGHSLVHPFLHRLFHDIFFKFYSFLGDFWRHDKKREKIKFFTLIKKAIIITNLFFNLDNRIKNSALNLCFASPITWGIIFCCWLCYPLRTRSLQY